MNDQLVGLAGEELALLQSLLDGLGAPPAPLGDMGVGAELAIPIPIY